MKVFIENEANSNLKNIHNEKTLEFLESMKVARSYPFPYGFILDTTAEDGDNIDAFVITKKELKRGEIVEVEVMGLMEQFEKSWDQESNKIEMDHNIIVRQLDDETYTFGEKEKDQLKDFVLHVFDSVQKNKTSVGSFLSKEVALAFIVRHLDN